MLPILAIEGVRLAARYVKAYSTAGPKWKGAILWVMSAPMIV